MTDAVQSFLDWWEGITAFMGDDPPSEKQWAAINKRVAALSEAHKAVEWPASARAVEVAHSAGPEADGSVPDTVIDWARMDPDKYDELLKQALMEVANLDAISAHEEIQVQLSDGTLDRTEDPTEVAKRIKRAYESEMAG